MNIVAFFKLDPKISKHGNIYIRGSPINKDWFYLIHTSHKVNIQNWTIDNRSELFHMANEKVGDYFFFFSHLFKFKFEGFTVYQSILLVL